MHRINKVTWKSKIQYVVARSAEAEFRAMAHGDKIPSN